MTTITELEPVHDSRHALRPGPYARESLVFMLQLPEHDVASWLYTWVNGEGRAGRIGAAFGPAVKDGPIFEAVDGIAVPDSMGFDTWSVGRLDVRHGEALERAQAAYVGERMQIEYEFEAMHPAYAYGSHRDGCPPYVADNRFEQSGRVRGVLTVDGREFPFETYGHRDHSWGTRDWGAAQHWKWMECQAGEDTAVHFFDISAVGRRQLRGYIHRDGLTSPIVDVASRFETDPQLWHTSISAQVRDEAGREVQVDGTTFARVLLPASPLLHLNECSMAVTIDGQPGVGHVEMAWPPDYITHVVESGLAG
ncbi:MAG TPA: hypothetical protein VHX88_04415 [Solirubrobacteraceae bacterium]|jgi:hypothetical protein|nr:hypothetical protein [Solirubrobacteraceae bacterium]